MRTDLNLKVLNKFYSALGVPQEIEGTGQLVVLQKVALLGKLIVPSLDYSYNWYIKGPYSPSLTEACFELQGYLDNFGDSIQFCFNEKVNKNLQVLSKIFHKYDNDKTIFIEWIEALAYVTFLTKKTLTTDEEVIVFLTNRRPDINKELFIDAISTLKIFDFNISAYSIQTS